MIILVNDEIYKCEKKWEIWESVKPIIRINDCNLSLDEMKEEWDKREWNFFIRWYWNFYIEIFTNNRQQRFEWKKV